MNWTDEIVKECCGYVGLRVAASEDISQQINLLVEDFKKAKEKPTHLFVTEDGVEIFEGVNFYSVDIEKWYWLGWMATQRDAPYDNSSHKYFSTDSAAKEYILLNKPMFSLQEIKDNSREIQIGEWHGFYKFDIAKFISMAKSKIV